MIEQVNQLVECLPSMPDTPGTLTAMPFAEVKEKISIKIESRPSIRWHDKRSYERYDCRSIHMPTSHLVIWMYCGLARWPRRWVASMGLHRGIVCTTVLAVYELGQRTVGNHPTIALVYLRLVSGNL